MNRKIWIISVSIALSLLEVQSNDSDVVGCGGYVMSNVSINLESIQIQLMTDRSIIKYTSECAPNNGYYFIPLYDHGSYKLKVLAPSGWMFEPDELNLEFDGVNDLCSKQIDINFIFKGYTIFGKVISVASNHGPKGVQLSLQSKSDSNVIKNNVTIDKGFYQFYGVLPGKYLIKAKHEKWRLLNDQIEIEVINDNIDQRESSDCSRLICLKGFSVIGKVFSDSRPIEGVQFILFGKHRKPPKTISCLLSKPTFLKEIPFSEDYHYWCHQLSNKHGSFQFESLLSGSYRIYSHYDSQNIRFEVKPLSLDFEIDQDDLVLDRSFEIGGFKASGQVLNNLMPNLSIENVRIDLFDENKKTGPIVINVFDQNGKFVLNDMRTSNYLIKTSAENYQFDDIRYSISPNSPNLTINPSRFKVCIEVILKNFQHKFEDLELFIMDKSQKTLLKKHILKENIHCSFLSGADYLFQIDSKYSNIKFVPKSLEVSIRKPEMDLVFEQMIVNLDGTIKLKNSNFNWRDDPDFLTVNIADGNSIIRTLNVDDFQIDQNDQLKFVATNLLPGDYIIKLAGKQLSIYCWQHDTIPIALNDVKKSAEVVLFEQKGFLMQISLSHEVDLLIRTPSGSIHRIDRRSISKDRIVRHCATEIGKYQIESIGCHKFFPDDQHQSSIVFDTNTMIGQTISLTAIKHQITARIVTKTNRTDLSCSIKINSNDGERTEIIELKNSRPVSPNNFEYIIEYYVHPMSTVLIFPKSNELIFKPSQFEFQVKDQCQSNIVTFEGRNGVFVDGRISQNIPDVKINVYDENSELLLKTLTVNERGEYRAGPFDETTKLKIEAIKDDFVFKQVPGKLGYFEVSKLSSITVNILDANDKPLSEVLVSLSGGEKNFRRNTFVDSDGQLLFDHLYPGQYFIKFLRKEYNFDPSSKIINITNGENLSIKIIGKKVAFSCIGKVTSLNGEPEPDVIIEAIGSENVFDDAILKCTLLQEQSVTEADGSFRILGLLPDCEYEIRIKPETLIQKNISKSIPTKQSVTVLKGDAVDFHFIIFHNPSQTELSASINVDEEYLESITIKLSNKNSQNLLFKQKLSGPFVFLPKVSLDNQLYLLELDSDLDRRHHLYEPISVLFQANQSYFHFDLDFLIEKNFIPTGINDQELSQNNSINFLLILFVCGVICYQKFVQDLIHKFSLNLILNWISGKVTYSRENNSSTTNSNQIGNFSTNAVLNSNSNEMKKYKAKKHRE
ncbi:homeobox protein ceh-1-like [Sarcoptes scabiei]|nr:homeobox protein ceh-1-like [Sarcoptes scabiei]